MYTPTSIVRLRQPDEIDDPLTEVLRTGARRLLTQAVEMEAEAFLAAMHNGRSPTRAGCAGRSQPCSPMALARTWSAGCGGR